MFENEVIEYIRGYCLDIEVFSGELLGTLVHIRHRNLAFHLIPLYAINETLIWQTYFQEKMLHYASLGVHLVHLWQDCWATKQAIIKSRVAMLCGVCNSLQARKTVARRITKDVANKFLYENHLQSSVNGRYNYGLYYEERLVAAASFSSPRIFFRENNKKCRSFELLRYANLLHYRIIGGIGKIISLFDKELNPDDIMTYADLDWSQGKSYQTLKFAKVAMTVPQQFWVHKDTMLRYNENKISKELKTTDIPIKKQDYIKIYNAGNFKYILDC
jgi:hypothetical protein